jgi:methylenetetrahydrofolate--tRNA-(uracil-5-)-methyltransferase
MRPEKQTSAHGAVNLPETGQQHSSGQPPWKTRCGLLNEEMRLLDSFIMSFADGTKVPAGGALAVDRNHFAGW